MEHLINHYNNSLQNLENDISAVVDKHKPAVLAAGEAIVNSSSDAWEVSPGYPANPGYTANIYNSYLKLLHYDNGVPILKPEVTIDKVEELKIKLENNDILDTSYRLAHDWEDSYDITIEVSNKTFEIKYDCYYGQFRYNISKNNLINILNKLIEFYST